MLFEVITAINISHSFERMEFTDWQKEQFKYHSLLQ